MSTIFLSAGHGGSDPGAVSNDLKEKDVNLNILLGCKETLEKNGVNVVCSRTTDENDSVSEEVKEANSSGCDFAISFHNNAGGGDGFEAYYYSTNAEMKKLAEICEKHIKALGQNSRGLKSGNHLYFIRKTKMPALLLETFFLDNKEDLSIGDTVTKQYAIGVAYANAIMEYLGITPISETEVPETTEAPDWLESVAREIIAGKWGNGSERYEQINKTIQSKVNEILKG